jgi:hypothetical protein
MTSYYHSIIYLITLMVQARLTWLGHLFRIEENSPCKKIIFSQPEGSQKKEDPN